MATPYLSEIRIVGFVFPPKGWALCNGQLLPINQNQALFALLGTTYGGDGNTVFALPNFQGRAPIHMGNGYVLGQAGGETAHTLTIQEIPSHLHAAFGASSNGTAIVPGGNLLATTPDQMYAQGAPTAAMDPGTVGAAGGSVPHNNMQPYLVLTFIIALQGVFPSRS